jgi:hypothetical protein
MNRLWFIIPVVIFSALLLRLDRLFLKSNNGFCLHYIHVPLKTYPEWKATAPFPKEALSQSFTYLGKGSQTYVFESEDGKYVIKFYKFPSHMRSIGWLKHPFAYRFEERRKKIAEHNLSRFKLSYNSYFLATSSLPEETGVIYAHLNPSKNLHHSLTIIDKMGHPYALNLDEMGFIVQRKAQRLFDLLDTVVATKDVSFGKKIIDDTIRVIQSRCSKGISDLDAMIHNNYGWLDGRAIHIDVGRFVKDPSVKNPLAAKKEVIRITQQLSDYLAKSSPELSAYYQQKIQET